MAVAVALQGPSKWLLAAAVVALLGLLPASGAAHRLHVRARTSISLTASNAPARQEVSIGGRLVDSRGRGVAGQTVQLLIRWLEPGAGLRAKEAAQALTRDVRSGATGLFRSTWRRAELPLREGRLEVKAKYFSSDTYAGVTQTDVFDLQQARGEVRLELEPMRFSTDLDALKVSMFAGVDSQPLSGRPLRLEVDGRLQAVLHSGPDGWVETMLPTSALLPAGTHRVAAQMFDTRDIRGARAETALQVVVAVDVELAIRHTDCPEGRICLEGRVVAHRGDGETEPAWPATVMIDAERVRLGHVPVRRDGRFAVSLKVEALTERFEPGPLAVVAVAEVPRPFHLTGLSAIIAVDVPPPPALSPWLYFALLASLALVLVARRWLDRRRERSLAEELAAAAAGLPIHAVRRVGPGGHDGYGIRGAVIHGETGRPIRASLSLNRATLSQGDHGGALEVQGDAQSGLFEAGPLEAGVWTLTVLCDEHEPLSLEIEVPHDGTFDGCELLPRSCRALARNAFGRAVRVSSRSVDWRQETPRDVEPRWRAAMRRGHREVRSAVATVERALYGRRTEPDDVQRVRASLKNVDEAQ